jgi:hypothetical protein
VADRHSLHRLQINQAAFVTYAWDAFLIGSMLFKIGNLLDDSGAVSGGDKVVSGGDKVVSGGDTAVSGGDMVVSGGDTAVSGGDMEWSDASTLLPSSSPGPAIMPSGQHEPSTQMVPLHQSMASNPSSGTAHGCKWNQDGWEH